MLRTMETLKKQSNFNEDIKRFVFAWNQFFIDYWWRKKYNIPFGSKQHREMSFIDMAIEYKEALEMTKALKQAEIDEVSVGSEYNGVRLTQEEIDEDYDNLDLAQFDK